MAGLNSKRRYQIRRLFFGRRDSYSSNDAARLLGVRHLHLMQRITSGEWEAHPDGVEYRMTYAQLVYAAMDVWSLAAIYDALGENEVLPTLLRPVPMNVNVPEYQLIALKHLAYRASLDLEEFLWRALLDLVCSAPTADIEKQIPGYRAALMFPD